MKKNEKGITLIVLVITIIILIILASVTISAIVKKQGVVDKASKSALDTAIADAKDEIERAVNSATTDSLVYNNGKYLAEAIDNRLRELAWNGSDYRDIRYVYNYRERASVELEQALVTKLRSGNILGMSALAMATDAVAAPPALDALEAAAATEEPEQPKHEYRYFRVYYKENLVVVGVLDMENGDFNFEEPEKVMTALEEEDRPQVVSKEKK